MSRLAWVLAASLMAGTVGTALANHGGPHPEPGHEAHAHAHAHGSGPDTPAVREYKTGHERMMGAMNLPFTGDPDVDFRVHMIPHHQGAIDMARVAMRHAKDAWTRQLAEAIIVEQQREIAEMQAWLANHGAPVPPGGQPTHIISANSYRSVRPEAGTHEEARGQSWAPGSGVPRRP